MLQSLIRSLLIAMVLPSTLLAQLDEPDMEMTGYPPRQTGPAAEQWVKALYPDAATRAALRKAAANYQSPLAGADVTLVSDAKPVATIVTGEDGKGAAGIVAAWIELMSGAKLAVASEAGDGPAIYIGEAAVAQGLRLESTSVTAEGIAIVCDGKNVLIGAESTPALTRAAARFLEEAFGCRYFAEHKFGRVYPSRPTLTVGKGKIMEKPTAEYRRIWGANGAFRGGWKDWNGHGGKSIPMSHSWGGVLPAGSFETNPEWYRLDENGQRVKGHWYNLGNPEVRKQFMDWAIKSSANGTRNFSLSPPDDHRVDYSPEATKYDDLDSIDPSSARVSMTNRFLGIANEAALAVWEQGKKARMGFYAYSDYTLPPTDPALQKLAPNLCVWIAPIRFSRSHANGNPYSASRQLLKQIIDGWAACASALGYRTYNYNLAEVMTPYSKLGTWANDLPDLHKKGCIGYNFESFNSWELCGPHLYLSIRLSYDPTANPWAIMADYWTHFYGPAAESMENYWLEIDQAWQSLETESGSIHTLHAVYTPERLARLDSLLSQAESLSATDPAYAYRVSVARRGLTRANYWRQWFDHLCAGQPDEAYATVQSWLAFAKESISLRQGNDYDTTYLSRFIARPLQKVYANTAKANGHSVLAVLPDVWKYRRQPALAAEAKPWQPDFDDSDWDDVKTFSATLNEQGYLEYFGNMWYRASFMAPATDAKTLTLQFCKADRLSTVWINGQLCGAENGQTFNGREVEVSDALRPGQLNQVTIRIKHVPLPELFLGGIVQPIYLVAKAAAEPDAAAAK